MNLTPVSDIEGIFMSSDLMGEPALVCPVCKYDYSHIREVHTELSGADAQLNEGSSPYPGTVAAGVTHSRRQCLVITFDGECEHAWELRIQQHKGVNYISTRVLEQRSADDDPVA